MNVLEVKDRVQRLLSDLVGPIEIDRDGDFTFTFESTRVWVAIYDWPEQEQVIVRVQGIPLWEVPGSPALFERVATDALDMRFGALSLFKREDGTYNLNFCHSLLGGTLDPDELKHALLAVAFTADRVDDEYQKEFGGKRWVDFG